MHFVRFGILGVTIALFAPFAAFAQIPAPTSLPAQNLPCKAEMDALTAKYPPQTTPDAASMNAMTSSAESKALQDCLKKNMPSPGAVGSPIASPPLTLPTSTLPAAVPQSYTGFAPTQTRSCPLITKNLSFGSRGPEVIQLQQYLISQGLLAPDSATGYFGKLTEAVMQQWQSARGVVSSGTAATTGYGAVGPKTRAVLASACSPTSPKATSGTVGQGTITTANQSLIDSLLAQLKVLQEKLAQLIAAKGGGGSSSSSVSPTYTYTPPSSTNTTQSNSTNTASNASSASCTWSGGTVANGSSVAAYQSSSVAYGSQCVFEQRTCTNGTLSGSYTNPSCSVASNTTTNTTAASCSFNGQTIASGSSVTAYQSSSVSYGSQCVS